MVTVPTVPATSGLVKLAVTVKWSAIAGTTVSGWVGAELRAVSEAVIVGVPVWVSHVVRR